jgi:hypothetical protein
MTSAELLVDWYEIGARVYVDPNHPQTPWKTGGLVGVVNQVVGDGARVTLGVSGAAEESEMPLAVLRHDRRAARRPATPA